MADLASAALLGLSLLNPALPAAGIAAPARCSASIVLASTTYQGPVDLPSTGYHGPIVLASTSERGQRPDIFMIDDRCAGHDKTLISETFTV
jgi:hypothetical protein